MNEKAMKMGKQMLKNFKRIFFVCMMMLSIITGCTGQAHDQSVEIVTLKGDDIVLARVGGSPVTQYELEKTIETTLGRITDSKLDDVGKQKVLESLVSSRAIAQACEKQLTPEECAELDKKVQDYREQVLVKKYISKNVSPEPVTQGMIEEYYKANPEMFGAKTIRTYEMISTDKELQKTERDALLKTMTKPETIKNWEKWVAELKLKGLPVFYKKGVAVEKLLHPRILSLINTTDKGVTSKLTFVEGRPYILRVIEVNETPPRPLAEVSTRIRKSLVPIQLRKAVQHVSDDVLKTATVVYEKNEK